APLRSLAQVVDRLEAGGVALDQHELEALPEHGLDGPLVTRLDPEHVRDQAIDAVAPPLLLLAQHDGLDAPAVPFEVLLQLEQRGEAAAPVSQLFAKLDQERLGLALFGASPGEAGLGGDPVLVQLAALRFRLGQFLGQLGALALDPLLPSPPLA